MLVKKKNWKKLRRRFGNNEFYSVSNKLRTEKKINEEFEIMLSSLTLEDIIALRLELAARAVNGNLYGLNIWQNLPTIVKAALLRYTYSSSRPHGDAAAFLGIDKSNLKRLLKKFNIKNFFKRS